MRIICYFKGHKPYPLFLARARRNPWYLARCERCHKYDESFEINYMHYAPQEGQRSEAELGTKEAGPN